MVGKLKRAFSKNVLVQICQYFAGMIAGVILFYAIFYIIYAGQFDWYIERTKGAWTIPIILKNMLGIVCVTIFPVLVPFMIVFGYIRSKRIYIPVIAAILLLPFFLLIISLYYYISMTIAYLITIIFGVLLAYFFKLFFALFKKLENKMHGILIFLLKILILFVIYLFLFYIIYMLFSALLITLSIGFWYTHHSWNQEPLAPYYFFALSIILSFFLGADKKYLVYNAVFIAVLLFLFVFNNTGQFSYDIKHLYLYATFLPIIAVFILFFAPEYEYFILNDILLLLLAFFMSSSIFTVINLIIEKRRAP